MNLAHKNLRWLIMGVFFLSLGLFLVGCSNASESETGSAPSGATGAHEHEEEQDSDAGSEMLALHALQAAELNGQALKVVATTSIIGDVVSQVGGDSIELTTLLGPGQDPHSYVAAARDLTAVAGADIIFVNGWDLEEGLADDLKNIGEDVPFVPISANIVPLAFGTAEDGHDHEADPHVWFSVHNVEQWVENVQSVLSDLDPANAAAYEGNAAAYLVELEELQEYAETELAGIPEENRFLVTNHDAFGYLADAYGLMTLGTVIPGASTLAEPSASDLAQLITEMEAHGVCTIFTETAVSDTLAQTVAGELSDCDEVRVVPLYSGSTGTPGSGADSYSGMFRANVDSIVSGLE